MMALDRSPIRVVGRYALYNEIAAGGMATIHLGRLLGPVGFARTVAIKRLHPQFAKDPEFVSMFLDEARLAARVQHPNVVATIDVVATDGELFLIMDYVRGESLSKIVRTVRKQGKRIPPRIAASIMCGFLHGLHAAHEAKNERGEPLGLVHRDVSPQNVLVGTDGVARVLDFGIAKATGRIQVTREGHIKGKLAYMPPEQLTGREVSRAVDIYASAVVMWETLTGERLFKGETEGETLAKILRDPVVPPSSVDPEVTSIFDEPLMQALSRDVLKRPATAKELAISLERCSGLASPTEVGEWVEELVGHLLDAREVQIAEIESGTVGMTASELSALSDTGSDTSIPANARAVLATAGSGDTPPLGSSPMLAHGRVPTPSAPFGPASPRASSHYFDETTGSKSGIATLFTGTALALPIDRRLPIFGSLLGIVVLFVIVGVIVAGKFSSDSDASAGPVATVTSPANAAPTATPSSAPELPTKPAPPDDVSAKDREEPVSDDPPRSEATTPDAPPPAAPPPKTSPRAAQTKPAPPPRPAVSTPPPPKPAAKGNCDPPFTIDAAGRRKYKLECL